MASQMITPKETESLQKLFRTLDKNGDGTLSSDELVQAFSKRLND